MTSEGVCLYWKAYTVNRVEKSNGSNVCLRTNGWPNGVLDENVGMKPWSANTASCL